MGKNKRVASIGFINEQQSEAQQTTCIHSLFILSSGEPNFESFTCS
jgi:hypothetical protein